MNGGRGASSRADGGDYEPATSLVHVNAFQRIGVVAQRGGSASVFPVHLEGRVWACKRYDDVHRSQLQVPHLQEVIAWRRALSDADRAYLDSRAAWPRSVVVDDCGESGVLLPLAPATFLEQPGADVFKPRHLTRITRPHEQGRVYYEMPEKLARLGQLGELMMFLHARDVVIGDLQPNNVLTTAPGTQPDVLLIDCDSVLLRGSAALPQVDPGHYKLPKDRSFNRSSDYFKFATLAVRCVEEDNTACNCRDVRAKLVMRTGDLALLRRALSEEAKLEDGQRWQALLRNWRSSVSASGELSHRNDDFVKRPWPGSAVLAESESEPVERFRKRLLIGVAFAVIATLLAIAVLLVV